MTAVDIATHDSKNDFSLTQVSDSSLPGATNISFCRIMKNS